MQRGQFFVCLVPLIIFHLFTHQLYNVLIESKYNQYWHYHQGNSWSWNTHSHVAKESKRPNNGTVKRPVHVYYTSVYIPKPRNKSNNLISELQVLHTKLYIRQFKTHYPVLSLFSNFMFVCSDFHSASNCNISFSETNKILPYNQSVGCK